MVAGPCRRRARDARGCKAVGRTGRARARAGLGHVARTRHSTAGRARVPRRVLTRDVGAVALIERAGVAVRRARRPRALLRVGRAAGPVAGAVLRRVALARARAAHRARRQEAVGRTGRAQLGRAPCGVAWTRHPPARPPRVPRRVLTGVVGAVALIERAGVAVRRARRPRALLPVGRAAGPVAGAVLRRVALARARAAHRARRQEAVGRTGRARPRAGLGDVAWTR